MDCDVMPPPLVIYYDAGERKRERKEFKRFQGCITGNQVSNLAIPVNIAKSCEVVIFG